MSQNLYFAYGSNLNLSDLNAWLERNGYSPDLLEFHSPACLPDFEPAFTYRSASRGGGVLSIRERTGSIVEGVVFKVREGGWEALDSKEGAPRCYRRHNVTVLTPNGAAIRAVTYRVTPCHESRFVAPTDDYVSVVRAGMKRWRISDQAVTAASRNRRPPLAEGLFVYGTLLRNGSRFSLLAEHGIRSVILAETFGQLADLGQYPAMFNLDSRNDLVQGELVLMRNPQSLLQLLDVIEGFRGFGVLGSLFQRTRITVDAGEGRLRHAWTYYMDTDSLNSGTTEAMTIPSGSWRVRCGTHERFIERLVAEHVGNNERALAERLAGQLPFSFMDRQVATDSLLPLKNAILDGRLSERRLAQVSGCWTANPAIL
ncbi:MAG: gamma-glutamylcyclotransferase [Planctomyces sp.]|jgi:gamma-glutamylcyclotransferase (GGCT)/AIG2-like uncharacterized protein YtfP